MALLRFDTRVGCVTSQRVLRFYDAWHRGRPGARGRVARPGGGRDAPAQDDFVTPTGGGYSFAPPISAIDGILATG